MRTWFAYSLSDMSMIKHGYADEVWGKQYSLADSGTIDTFNES